MHWLIFTGLGPLIGLACVFAAVMVDSRSLFDGKLVDAIQVMAWFTVLAYIVGLMPALVSGWAVRQVHIRRLRPEWLWVTLTGTIIGFIFVVAFGTMLGGLHDSAVWDVSDIRKEAFLVFVPTCLVSTLVCWYLSRGWAKRLGQVL